MQVRRLDGLGKNPPHPSTCSRTKKQSTKRIQTVVVQMSYTNSSTLTPNSGFRTIQIKRTPGNEFPTLNYSLLHTGSWQFLSHPKPTREQIAPAQIHGTAERLGRTSPAASPESPPGTTVLGSEPVCARAAGNTGYPRTHRTTQAHQEAAYSSTSSGPCKRAAQELWRTKPAGRWGEGTQP